jgi:sodium-dependent phosphate cotransporter
MTVLILLPLEIMTGFLRRSATALSSVVSGFGGADFDSPIKLAIKAGGAPIEGMLEALLPTQHTVAIAYILVSGALIFFTLVSIVKVMRSSMQTRMEALVSRALAKNAVIAMMVGVVTTVMVQSSSITTSLMVPLAGAGVLSLKQAFPVTLGANIGTTITALLAAMAATGVNAQAGLTIALVHLLFNLSGTILIYPYEPIRRIPMHLASVLANVAVRSKVWAIIYVAGMFYAVPVLFAVLHELMG